MTILESLRNYIKQCPYLEEFNGVVRLRVDFSDNNEATTYNIEEGVTSQPIIKRYVDGSTIRQYLIVFSSIEAYSADIQQNIDNCGFYEDFQQWLEDNTNNNILPIMGQGKEARSIEALTNGYIFDNAEDSTTARYQIQMRLTYFQN
ncbi:chloramphenicol resistance protein [Clostridium sp. 'White wine YQ']|uniref:chloramphenicol resistance protein n=1 Tax=Clostridium sp. 'White wine YQ' TaxID=3027474 RepID=UPI002365EBDB|nr:chloramphenicol resistance protein [Clostridium sp. 'White wine YQ']MDD7793694.1 chloramphenicol resistance protein [Clostridium sp. 'White wine YQ']